jgi:molybdenum cofactor biosynthesis enzyme MoaA
MHEINNLHSLSLFVGTAACNADCSHCAGRIHRKFAPKKDGMINKGLIYKTLKYCYKKGARYLSLSGSGEPTLSPKSVTKVLQLVHECRKEGIKFFSISLYTNGIRIGEDKDFCSHYLSLWKKLGLTTIYVTVHNIDERENAEVYRIKSYPSLQVVFSRIHQANLLVRANLVLSKRTTGTLDRFVQTSVYLINSGVDSISTWPIRSQNDKIDFRSAPSEQELDKIECWIRKNKDFGHKIKLLREKSHILYKKRRKLTLFPDSTLSNSWCN